MAGHPSEKRTQHGLRAVLATTAEGSVLIGPSGTVRLMNEAAERLLGRTRGEVVGREFDVPAATRPRVARSARRSRARATRREVRRDRRRGPHAGLPHRAVRQPAGAGPDGLDHRRHRARAAARARRGDPRLDRRRPHRLRAGQRARVHEPRRRRDARRRGRRSGSATRPRISRAARPRRRRPSRGRFVLGHAQLRRGGLPRLARRGPPLLARPRHAVRRRAEELPRQDERLLLAATSTCATAGCSRSAA